MLLNRNENVEDLIPTSLNRVNKYDARLSFLYFFPAFYAGIDLNPIPVSYCEPGFRFVTSKINLLYSFLTSRRNHGSMAM